MTESENTSASSTKRIAKNTLMLYFRQMLIMLVSLYTVRIILNTLGAEDYGIYNVVAGVVTMFGFLSGAMATASQRFFSFELGKGDNEKLKKTFSVTLCIYLLLILIIVFLAETVGLWFVNHKLVIPPERLTAAKWIYQFSILSFVVTLITTPYMASIIAHENMNVYAYVSIIEAVLKLVIVFVLKTLPYDKLILYGLLLFVVGFINTALYRGYCKKYYKECAFHPVWDKVMFWEISSYVGWNLFGSAVGVFNNQILNIILNQFFGPVVNAARAIASQVNSAVTSFSHNFSTAIRPQMIKSYAAQQVNETHILMFRSCKITFFLMFIFTLPLVVEMPFILKLWLKAVPEYTIIFTQMTLIEALITSMSYPIMTLSQATGKIKLYQGIVGGILLCNLPISYILLYLGFSPYSVMICQVIVAILATIVRIFIANYLSHFSVKKFFIKIILPLFIVLCVSSVVPVLVAFTIKESLLRFIFEIIICTSISCLVMFIIGFNKDERIMIIHMLKKRLGVKV